MTGPEKKAENDWQPPHDEDALDQALLRYPLAERMSWRAEALRLVGIVSEYARVKPKRRRDPKTGKYEFTSEVRRLCEQARCSDAVVLTREPHRARSVSPHTLDNWLREWRRGGLTAFLRQPHNSPDPQQDQRYALMSAAAVDYINENWRRFRSPRALYLALREEGDKQGWTLPSESWLYRRWQEMPEVVRVAVIEGKAAYESRCAPYVPRNYEDLEALQVVCGDHSERDVTVLVDGKDLARPWVTVWQDLRTGLIWGWYLGLKPSSESARLAYADGVLNFGAQPFARPADDFHSYVYTDRGKDYCSHDWSGKVIAVHERAIDPDAELECHLVERRVGVLEEFGVKRLLARGYNAKEKPVERFFKDLSEWEANTFAEYCGSHPHARPDRWRELYRRHQDFLSKKAPQSPFISFDQCREELKEFIRRWHERPHDRITLGGRRVKPIEEFHRLYTTRYEMKPETVALALLKPDVRTVTKNGVHCFRRDWFYWNPIFSGIKRRKIEIRFTERDYRRIWVVLPNKNVEEAELVTPTPLLNPNQETLRLVSRARQQEKKLINEFQLLAQSQLRGESVEDRVNQQISGPPDTDLSSTAAPRSTIYPLNRLERRPLKAVSAASSVEIDEPAEYTPGLVTFSNAPKSRVSEFDEEE